MLPKKFFLGVGIFISAIVIIISCKHEIPFLPDILGNGGAGNASNTCSPDSVYFDQQVLPILVSNCAMSGCHDNTSRAEGVVTISYTSVITTAGVRKGNPSGSKLYTIVANNAMPPKSQTPLTQVQKDLIYKWIQQGAQNLHCANACGDTVNITYNLSVKPIIDNKCQGCHNSLSLQGGIDLSTYTAVKAQVTNGKLWGSVNYNAGFSPMPKGGSQLSVCELTIIQKWINKGSLNN